MHDKVPSPLNETTSLEARVFGFPRDEPRETATRLIEFPVRLTASLGSAHQAGREQWLRSFLAQLGPGEALTLRIALGKGGGLWLGALACAGASDVEARARHLASAFTTVIDCALPRLRAARPLRTRPILRPYAIEIRPAGRNISLDDLAQQSLRPVPSGGSANAGAHRASLRVPCHPARRPDLAAAGALLSRPELRGAALMLSISPFCLDAVHARAIQEFLKGLSDHLQSAAPRLTTLFYLNEEALGQLKQWCIADRSLRIGAELTAPREVSPVMLDMLCQALYGDTRSPGEGAGAVDLTTAWPDLDLSFLDRLPAIPAAQARLAPRLRTKKGPRGKSIALGTLDDGSVLRLDQRALEQHLYLIGGTGTGKSTLMLNMIGRGHAGGPRCSRHRCTRRPVGEGSAGGSGSASW
jgi:hypothetical protein